MKLIGDTKLMIAAGVGAAALLYYVMSNPTKAGAAVGGAVGGAVAGAASGVVTGVGSAIGIPLTDATKCAACKKIRDTLGVSKFCSAPSFIQYLMTGK